VSERSEGNLLRDASADTRKIARKLTMSQIPFTSLRLILLSRTPSHFVRSVRRQLASPLDLLSLGGTFVVKYFGTRHEETREIFKRVARRFEEFNVVKPVSSRPASAERYLASELFEHPQGPPGTLQTPRRGHHLMK